MPAVGLQERGIIRVVETDAVILNDKSGYLAFFDGKILAQHGDLDSSFGRRLLKIQIIDGMQSVMHCLEQWHQRVVGRSPQWKPFDAPDNICGQTRHSDIPPIAYTRPACSLL
jgi:hypothetical protein